MNDNYSNSTICKEPELQVEFSALGNALRYGILYELSMNTVKNTETKHKHLRAAILWMHFKDMISKSTLLQCHIWSISHEIVENSDNENTIKRFSEIILKDLVGKYNFDNFEDLVSQLNDFTIPNWLLKNTEEIISLIPHVELIDEYLYYLINKEEAGSCLAMIKAENIIVKVDLQDTSASNILGTGFSGIAGSDKSIKGLYLTLAGAENVYVYYDCRLEEFHIRHMELCEMMNHVPVVRTNDGKLAYSIGNKEHVIKEYCDYEQYIVEGAQFRVIPEREEPFFFKPYYLSLDGNKKPCSDKYCRKYLWEFIITPYLEKSRERSITSGTIKALNQAVWAELTINSIKTYFAQIISPDCRTGNKNFVLFESVLELLSKYLDQDADITDLLYILCECDKKMKNKVVDEAFPSEELFWRLRELDLQSEILAASLKNVDDNKNDLLSLILANFAGSIKSKNTSSDSKEQYVGTFAIDEGKIVYEAVKLSDGVHVDDLILLPFSRCIYPGAVIYNRVEKKFIVHTPRSLSADEYQMIFNTFNIGKCKRETIVENSLNAS